MHAMEDIIDEKVVMGEQTLNRRAAMGMGLGAKLSAINRFGGLEHKIEWMSKLMTFKRKSDAHSVVSSEAKDRQNTSRSSKEKLGGLNLIINTSNSNKSDNRSIESLPKVKSDHARSSKKPKKS